ncbi:unnamed protein product [Hymenolepis diminuta]|uniref:H15 domain-containing protein n=1 Tax=Hymenolepis diminuta TaxID=6216 RepID=A0A0R3SP61_HYMDI|nr:unnamed protein product [Hymenolepis diminuta]
MKEGSVAIKEDSNKIPLHHVTPNIWPPPNYTRLLSVRRGVVEKEVNKHPHNTKSSSLMEAIVGAMEDINKDHLIEA